MQQWWDFGKAHFVSSKQMLPCNTVLVKHEELVESTGFIWRFSQLKRLKRACLSSSHCQQLKIQHLRGKTWTWTDALMKSITGSTSRLMADNSSQWCVSGLRYSNTDIHKCSQNKREPNVPVASSISVLISDRRTRAYSRHTAHLSHLLLIIQTQIQ